MRIALEKNPQGEKPEPRADGDILGEILKNTRSLTQRMREMESKLGPQRIESGGIAVKKKFEDGLNFAAERLLHGDNSESVFDSLVLIHDMEPKTARQVIEGVQKRLREVGVESQS